MKPVAEMIVDAASTHGRKALLDHLEGLWLAGALPVAQKEEEMMRRGKLGGPAEPAFARVELLGKVLIGLAAGRPAGQITRR